MSNKKVDIKLRAKKDQEAESNNPQDQATESNKPKATGAVKKAPVVTVKENGVAQPREGTLSASIWDICNSLYAQGNKTPTRAEVVGQSVEAGINKSTATTQYGRWVKHKGYPTAARVANPAIAWFEGVKELGKANKIKVGKRADWQSHFDAGETPEAAMNAYVKTLPPKAEAKAPDA